MQARRQESPRRCEGEAGTALVELAFILAPLCLLLFGIVVYGYLMSFRQNMTSAAAEGARAGAIAPPDNTADTHALALAQAKDATDKALGSFGEGCGTLVSSTASSTQWTNSRTTCLFSVATCPTPSTLKCMTAEVDYDYGGHPLMPDIPIVSNAIPSTFTSKSTAQINQ